MQMLDPSRFRPLVDRFNALDVETVINLIPNAQSWDWLAANVPLFECPDPVITEIYYYRWWTYRKHIKKTPAGRIVTEFIEPVKHAGMYNSISCAVGHHLAEGRWLREQEFLDEYTRFWFTADNGKPEPRFHRYSSWLAAAMWNRAMITGGASLIVELFDELVDDYAAWEREKLRDDGLFWQHDVWDGMEESISGSRKHKNARPTINSYMFGNAWALSAMASAYDRDDLARLFLEKATKLRHRVLQALWDTHAKFFKAQTAEDGLSDAREAIGFVPWMFNLPYPDAGYEEAWKQLIDPQGFWAPHGITTAERRHPKFRSHGVGKCEWDGAVWPFATSQTLDALANVLRNYPQPYVTRQHYLDAMRTYARCHQMNGQPYIGEYLCESTGQWLKGDNPRSRYYNHSTFCDLVIGGLCGIVARADETVEIDPLLPEDAWDWFRIDRVPFRKHELTILWDRDGSKYGGRAGLCAYLDGELLAHSPTLQRITGEFA